MKTTQTIINLEKPASITTSQEGNFPTVHTTVASKTSKLWVIKAATKERPHVAKIQYHQKVIIIIILKYSKNKAAVPTHSQCPSSSILCSNICSLSASTCSSGEERVAMLALNCCSLFQRSLYNRNSLGYSPSKACFRNVLPGCQQTKGSFIKLFMTSLGKTQFPTKVLLNVRVASVLNSFLSLQWLVCVLLLPSAALANSLLSISVVFCQKPLMMLTSPPCIHKTTMSVAVPSQLTQKHKRVFIFRSMHQRSKVKTTEVYFDALTTAVCQLCTYLGLSQVVYKAHMCHRVSLLDQDFL